MAAKLYLSFRTKPDVVNAIKTVATKERRTTSQLVEILVEEALQARQAVNDQRSAA